MRVDVRVFEKIFLFSLADQVELHDLAALDSEITLVAKRAAHVVLDFTQVFNLTRDVLRAALFLRDQILLAEKKKVNFRYWIVAPALIEKIDAQDLVTVLDKINTSESDRIVRLFKIEHECDKQEKILLQKKQEIEKKLSEKKWPNNLSDASIEAKLEYLGFLHKKNVHLFKVWSNEISQLKKNRVEPRQEKIDTKAGAKDSVELSKNSEVIAQIFKLLEGKA